MPNEDRGPNIFGAEKPLQIDITAHAKALHAETERANNPAYSKAVYFAAKLGILSEPPDYGRNPAIPADEIMRHVADMQRRRIRREREIHNSLSYDFKRSDWHTLGWPEIAEILEAECVRRGLIPAQNADADNTQLMTVEEVTKKLGRGWAEYGELAKLTGKTEAAIRADVSRLRKADKLKAEDVAKVDRDAQTSAKVRIKISTLWPHMRRARVRTQKN